MHLDELTDVVDDALSDVGRERRVTDPTPADETPEGPPAIEPPAVTADPLDSDHVRRAVRATGTQASAMASRGAGPGCGPPSASAGPAPTSP